jgi:hypothetical protein
MYKKLLHYYNASLSSGIFPNRLKTAKVIHLYRNGDIRDVKHSRSTHFIRIFQNKEK